MNNSAPSWLFVLFASIFFAGMLDMPILIVGFVIYMIVNSVSSNKRNQRQNQSRQQRQQPRQQPRYRDRHTTAQRPATRVQRPQQPKARKRPPRENPYKNSGLTKFKDYDYQGAIEDFEKALKIYEEDIAVHFNLACCYSLNENKDKSLYHLDRAIALGFKDTERIKNHDALAYIRIQEDFEAFEANGFRLTTNQRKTSQGAATQNNDLLEQLNKLAELREKGLLTEAEFALQKKRLLG